MSAWCSQYWAAYGEHLLEMAATKGSASGQDAHDAPCRRNARRTFGPFWVGV